MRAADVLAVGMGTAVAMWSIKYLVAMPLVQAPAALTLALLILTLFGGGVVLGRWSRRTWRGAVASGLVTSAVNLMALGALLVDEGAPSPMFTVPGSAVFTVAVTLAGFALGRRMMRRSGGPGDEPAWLSWLAIDTFAATCLVVLAGGLVTGFDSGFAVPDWPTSFGANMFLYPLSKMDGGIYYEHAHRLAGTLVGLAAGTLMVRVWMERGLGRGAKALATIVFVLVCLQGLAGALWVVDVEPLEDGAAGTRQAGSLESATGLSFDRPEPAPSGEAEAGGAGYAPRQAAPTLGYILFHGTLGQIILALFAVIAAMVSPTWRDRRAGWDSESASFDRMTSVGLGALIVVQLFLGVYLRKTDGMLLMHITVAGLVTLMVVAVGVRLWGVHGERQATLKRLGLGLLWLVMAQLVLGFVALIVRRPVTGRTVEIGTTEVAPAVDALVTTLHQSVGAAMLTLAALAAAWTYRLLKPTNQPAPAPTIAASGG